MKEHVACIFMKEVIGISILMVDVMPYFYSTTKALATT
jgi:hypothetical protein